VRQRYAQCGQARPQCNRPQGEQVGGHDQALSAKTWCACWSAW
jgi:hypothetical protein